MARILIVNADDFGLSHGINRGIIETHEQGLVTSTSLMVRGTAAAEAAEYARRNPTLATGLHVDLGEWSYRHGTWVTRYEVVPVDDDSATRTEIYRQLDTFRRLVGCEPTHIDSHQHVHVHAKGSICETLSEIANYLAVPLRHPNGRILYCGNFYGQPSPGNPSAEAVSVLALVDIIRSLTTGITELACHPGYADDSENDYGIERAWEVASLCDPDVKAAITAENILLRSFASPDVVEVFRRQLPQEGPVRSP